MHGQCKRCHNTLIEVDDGGTLFVGCLTCNSWRSRDGFRWVKLSEDDVEVLRKIRGTATNR
jgi:hypothetical protein